jgi:hypothetical protein
METETNMTNKQAIYDAFYAGQEAAYNRVAVTSNPYVGATYEEYEAWRDGWHKENAEQLDYEAAQDRSRARCW